MSFILDALKKSENERQRQSGPGVFQPRIASPRTRFPVWAVALGLLLGINLLVLIWVMTRPENAPPPLATTGAAPPSAAAPAAMPAPAESPSTTRFNPPLIIDPELVDAAGSAPAVDVPASVPPNGAAPVAAPQPTGPNYNPNDYLPAQPSPAGAATGTATPLGANPAAPGVGNYATREALVARGQSVPEVALSLHVYDADPAKRFVFVNGQRGTDGDSLASGLRIEQIVPQGAVLSWNGNRFLVPIQ
ncbi:MAG: general secretion pathway protein GspB [Steroidobacteraceae bacterium]